MINKFLIPGSGTLLLSAAVISTSFLLTNEYPYLKIIEFHFYDQSNQSKKLRLSVEDVNDIKSVSVFEEESVQAVSDSQNSESNGKWKQIDKISKSQETVMWNTLTDISKNFIQVQHNLNIVKSSVTIDLKELCKDSSKCCCDSKCDCKNGECCSTCICCYGKDCCCKKDNECNFDELEKEQKLFNFFLSNLLSWNDVYFGPVQAHIKLPSVSFNDLKNNSTSGDEQTTWAPLLGSLVYGFMNYSYKSIKSPQNVTSQDIGKNLDANKYSFFANIPQRFKFSYKKKGSNSSTEPTDSLNKLLSSLNSPKEVAGKFTKPSEIKSCCQENEDLNCFIARNYVFLKEMESVDLKDISDKIKNTKDCCS